MFEEGFEEFLKSKGFKVNRSGNDFDVSMKLGMISGTNFKLNWGSTPSGAINVLVYHAGHNYGINAFGDTCFEVVDSKCDFLFKRNVGGDLYSNLYALIRFLIGIDNIILSEVCYLIELTDKSKSDSFITPIVENIEKYRRQVGYRIKLINKSFKNVYFDVDLSLVNGRLDKFLATDRRFIIPVESIDGFYRNRHDNRISIKEIENEKQFQKVLRSLL